MMRRSRPRSSVMLQSTVLFGALLALGACSGSKSEGSPSSTASTPAKSSAAPSANAAGSTSTPSGSAGAVASASASVSAPPPKAPPVHCKAATSKKPSEVIGTHKDATSAMKLVDGVIYLATWNQPALSGAISAIPVDGAATKQLTDVTSKTPGELDGLAVGADDVFFTVADTLQRVPRAGGAASVVAQGFGRSVTIEGTTAYGVRFDKDSNTDMVNRVPIAGGAVETIYQRKREGVQETYDIRAAASDGHTVFIGDAGKRKIIAYDLTSKSDKVVKEGVAYPILFFFGTGDVPKLESVAPRDSGYVRWFTFDPLVLTTPTASGVFSVVSPYEGPTASVTVAPLKGGDGVDMAHIQNNATAIDGDDECAYVATNEASQTVVVALPRPAPK